MAHSKDVSGNRPQGSSTSADTAIQRQSLANEADPRLAVFCSDEGPEVFRSVCHRHEIWREDPFDVPTIHEDARDLFTRLLNQATTPPGIPAGRTLLILGESGAGKTHLMRVFRNQVHSRRLGYCGYLQMTSATDDYGQYVLSNLIDSLDQPYYEAHSDNSGLMCLSDALVEIPSSVLRKERESLREDRFDDKQLAKFIAHIADHIIEDERYAECDVHMVQALLYLQRDEPRIKSRVLSYLRCEDLSDTDRAILGGMVPRTDPERTIETLGRLMWALQSVSLVVCVDQLEDMAHLDRDAERFRRAVGTVCALAERVPSSLFVICCLEDLYPPLKRSLTRSFIDRLERDPEPLKLNSLRSWDEITGLVGQRLRHLYESADVDFDEADPIYPIPREQLEQITNIRTRDVLDWCRTYRNRMRDGLDVTTDNSQDSAAATLSVASFSGDLGEQIIHLTQLWNDCLADHRQPPPDDDDRLATLLSWAVSHVSREVDTGHRFLTTDEDGKFSVKVQGDTGVMEVLKIGVCNRSPLGGALSRQVDEIQNWAGDDIPILIRSTDFPDNPKTKIAQQIAAVVAVGGRRVVVEDSDWRAMRAMQTFLVQYEQEPGFADWLQTERPLAQLKSLRETLDLDALTVQPSAADANRQSRLDQHQAATEPEVTEEVPADWQDADQIPIGTSHRGRVAPVGVTMNELTQHVALLGGSGSGKTTVALNLIERLLLQGIPAVLVDRKGDLCGYAKDEFWNQPAFNEASAERKQQLREAVNVSVYTPGNPQGRGLSIPLVPEGLGELSSFDRELVANYSASALGNMMGYTRKQSDVACIGILSHAIQLLSTRYPDRQLTLQSIIEMVHRGDPELVNAVGRLNPKTFDKLVQDLSTLQLSRARTLSTDDETLNIDSLLGTDDQTPPKKTQLSIISTKFLGDRLDIEFWMSQFLMAVKRWGDENPSPELQAVFLFDEADLYLPAQSKPSTKGPMEDLLKRARSAGIGLLLATQSPGDFDYKCRDNIRTWLVGKIKEPTAIRKMKPMLSECKDDVSLRLPAQKTGEFHLLRDGEATAFQADRSLLVTEQLAEEEILTLAKRAG